MEKLEQLLNEWSKTALKGKCNWIDVYDEDGVYFLNLFDRDMTMEIEDVIGKRAEFIKWLVENDKIDQDKVENKFYNEICITDYGDKNRAYGKSDLVISVLSISDTPIDDLISYLK